MASTGEITDFIGKEREESVTVFRKLREIGTLRREKISVLEIPVFFGTLRIVSLSQA